ncbi:MAG: methyltransferase [Desulfovibrionaceae bacterium]|nr:methyltransferase [Desulfovibrionaceae bacterium]
MTHFTPAEAARSRFPRGLHQPEGSFRFSMDALLLAAFARLPQNGRLLDLGCGCGIIGLALLLAHPTGKAVGIDISPQLIECARQNAALLGLEARFNAHCHDLRTPLNAERLPGPEQFDLITANPPFRRTNQGNMPQHELRQAALFETAGGLPDFVKAASFFLKNRGSFCCIWSSERLAELICTLKKHRLEPKELLPVQARPGRECGLTLLRAMKNGGPGLKLAPPLQIYETAPRPGAEPGLTSEALEFCPLLACNAKR